MKADARVPRTATVVDRWLDGSLLFPIAAKYLERLGRRSRRSGVDRSRFADLACILLTQTLSPSLLLFSSFLAWFANPSFSLSLSRLGSLRACRFTLRAPRARSVRKFYDSLVRTPRSPRSNRAEGISNAHRRPPVCRSAQPTAAMRPFWSPFRQRIRCFRFLLFFFLRGC